MEETWMGLHMVHVKTAGVQPVTGLECFPGISFFDTLQLLLATGHLWCGLRGPTLMVRKGTPLDHHSDWEMFSNVFVREYSCRGSNMWFVSFVWCSPYAPGLLGSLGTPYLGWRSESIWIWGKLCFLTCCFKLHVWLLLSMWIIWNTIEHINDQQWIDIQLYTIIWYTMIFCMFHRYVPCLIQNKQALHCAALWPWPCFQNLAGHSCLETAMDVQQRGLTKNSGLPSITLW